MVLSIPVYRFHQSYPFTKQPDYSLKTKLRKKLLFPKFRTTNGLLHKYKNKPTHKIIPYRSATIIYTTCTSLLIFSQQYALPHQDLHR